MGHWPRVQPLTNFAALKKTSTETRKTLDSSVRLEVLDWGGTGRPVVLLGCYLTAHVYDDFGPKLANQFRVLGITRRGIGASDKPTLRLVLGRFSTR
jgi:hypothetical protein